MLPTTSRKRRRKPNAVEGNSDSEREETPRTRTRIDEATGMEVQVEDDYEEDYPTPQLSGD